MLEGALAELDQRDDACCQQHQDHHDHGAEKLPNMVVGPWFSSELAEEREDEEHA